MFFTLIERYILTFPLTSHQADKFRMQTCINFYFISTIIESETAQKKCLFECILYDKFSAAIFFHSKKMIHA